MDAHVKQSDIQLNPRAVRSILVVGGGTAGWLSAAYLQRALGSSVKITLIESSAVPTIGVGEATIPTLKATFRFLGMEEEDWMPKCNASYKMAIRFDDWERIGTSYYHAFVDRREEMLHPYGSGGYFPELGEGFSRIHHWVRRYHSGKARAPFAEECYPAAALCKAQKAPRHQQRRELDQASAYHFDAGLVAKYLRDLSVSRGVQHVVDHVSEIRLDKRGYVETVHTKSGRALQADLFIDCSGFRGLIINQKLGESFLSDNDSLLCDAAVAIPSRNDPERDGIRPYTIATALSAGWAWDVPLYHRNGSGYVYSSKFIEKDAAEAELRAFLGVRCQDNPANHIRMRVGRNRNVWVKNCVAIGLSSCFLEPLESTGIFLIEYQLAMLVSLFPNKDFAAPIIRKYNEVIRDRYEELRDFIVLHYILTKRDDSQFWNAVRHETKVPDSLKEKLEMVEHVFPVLDRLKTPVFRDINWAAILAGMNHVPKSTYPIMDYVNEDQAERLFADIKADTARLLEELPDHYQYLKSFRYKNATDPYAALQTPAE